ANGRVERMVYVTNRPEDFAKYGPDVTRMINGMKFPRPQRAEPLAGVCFGIVHVKTDVRAECWIFLPKGMVYYGFPYGGPAHADFEALRKWRPKAFSEYHVEGNEVVVKMPAEKSPIRFVESDGVWTATVTRP